MSLTKKLKENFKTYLPKPIFKLVSKTYITYIKFKRFFYSVKRIENHWAYILDVVGLQKEMYYIYIEGNKIFIRPNTADRIMIDDVISDQQYFKGIKKDLDVVIDLGAHIGLFSILVNANKIYSIEANKQNFKMLKKNVLENTNRITPFHLAISDSNKEVKLYNGRMNARNSIMIYDTNEYEIVKSSTLERFIKDNNIEVCNILKIDVEGAEYKILYSTPKEIFSRINSIVMELHDVDGEDKNKLVNHLIKMGYDVDYNGKNFLWAYKR